MESEIIAALDVPGVTTVLGDRIYLHFAPAGVDNPYCRFFEVVSLGVVDFDGVDDDGEEQHRYQFDFFGDDTADLRAARNAVLNALDDAFALGAYQKRQMPTDDPGNFHFLLDVTFYG